MGLKYEVQTLDEIDATLHDLYKPLGDNKFVLDVEGVKPLEEFAKVQGALEKERNDHRQLKQKFSPIADLEPESIKSQLARIAELEAAAAGKFDESKIEESVQMRLESKIKPILSEKEQLAKQKEELESKVKYFEEVDRRRRMTDEFVSKIKQAKIDPRFEETVMLKAEKLFVENEDGAFLTKDSFVPFDVWLSQQQATNSYWWGDTVGGGSTGSNSGYRGENPFVTGNYTKQAELFNQNPALAAKMAEAAGIKL